MAVICTVRIPHPLERVQEVEAANPEVMQRIVGPAMRFMTGHRRAATDGETMDIDEFASREDYDAFIGEAAPAIAEWNALLGTPAQDTVYTVVEGG